MLSSSTNRIALYVSAFIIISLVIFAIVRDNSQALTLNQAQEMLENHSVEKVVVTKEYVYLKTKEEVYKIASSQVTPKMFIDYQVEVGNESNIVLYILFIVLFLGLGSIKLHLPK